MLGCWSLVYRAAHTQCFASSPVIVPRDSCLTAWKSFRWRCLNPAFWLMGFCRVDS